MSSVGRPMATCIGCARVSRGLQESCSCSNSSAPLSGAGSPVDEGVDWGVGFSWVGTCPQCCSTVAQGHPQHYLQFDVYGRAHIKHISTGK